MKNQKSTTKMQKSKDVLNTDSPFVGQRFLSIQNQKIYSIPISDIAYFFIENKFVFIQTFNGRKFIINHSLDKLALLLDMNHFFRVNRSIIISYNAIAWVTRNATKWSVHLLPEHAEKVIVSQHKISEFKQWLGT